jgi:lipid-A-disaccharide synthase-like uncharacterized protein
MDWFSNLIAPGGKLFGIEWHVWKVIGWSGNAIFFSRFMVQWYATEKRKQVVVPTAFWWLSLLGTMILLSYALFYTRDSVFIFAYAFAWIPYMRNLVIHYRHMDAHVTCPKCESECPPQANFCCNCGTKVSETAN